MSMKIMNKTMLVKKFAKKTGHSEQFADKAINTLFKVITNPRNIRVTHYTPTYRN